MTRRLLVLLVALGLAGCARRPTAPLPAAPSPAAPSPAAPLASSTPEPPVPARLERVWTKGTRVVPVIMYHDVCAKGEVWFDLTTAEFERHMARLKAADINVVRLADLVAHLRDGAPLPERAMVLTFDDGCLGNYTDAAPILKRYGYPATFFVHTGFVGKKTSKMHLTWEQLKELQDGGLIDIQPHSVTHPEFIQDQDEAGLRSELRQSKEAIEQHLGTKALYYAHPYGNGDEKVAKALDELGYVAAWNEIRAPNAAPADRFMLPRFAPKRLDDAIAIAKRPQPGVWCVGPLPLRTDGGDRFDPGLGRALRRDGQRQALGEGEQLGLLGRPMVVTSADQVLFCRFGGWMNPSTSFRTPRDPLATLLPGTTQAAIGSDWAIHEGKAVGGDSRARAVVGVTQAGRLKVMRSPERTSRRKLAAEALRAGLVEAIAF